MGTLSTGERSGFFADSSGFTLVELVTVILLIGILSAVALPRFFDATAFNSRGFLDEVAGAVRYAQKLAVASGCDVQLSIDNATNAYALHQRVDSCTSGTFTRAVLKPAGSGAFAGAAPSGTILLSTSPSIIFDALGRATSGGATVTVGDRSFTVAGESGYVDVP
jgi:MSHA pilin protein MshC